MEKLISNFKNVALSRDKMKLVTGGEIYDENARETCTELGTSVDPTGKCFKVYSCKKGGRTYAKFEAQPATKCHG
jgi:hypothetical protein